MGASVRRYIGTGYSSCSCFPVNLTFLSFQLLGCSCFPAILTIAAVPVAADKRNFKKEETHRTIRRALPIVEDVAYQFFYRTETEICFFNNKTACSKGK
jgi:hypothetical protein